MEKEVACSCLYFLAHGLFKLKFYKEAYIEIHRLLALEENYPNGKAFKELCLERMPKSEAKSVKKMSAKKNIKPVVVMTSEEAKVNAEKDKLRRFEIAAKYATQGPELDEEEVEKEAKKAEILRIRTIRTLRSLGQSRGFGGIRSVPVSTDVVGVSSQMINTSKLEEQPKRPSKPAPPSLVEKVQLDNSEEKSKKTVKDKKRKTKKKSKDQEGETNKATCTEVKPEEDQPVKQLSLEEKSPPKRPLKPSGIIVKTLSEKNYPDIDSDKSTDVIVDNSSEKNREQTSCEVEVPVSQDIKSDDPITLKNQVTDPKLPPPTQKVLEPKCPENLTPDLHEEVQSNNVLIAQESKQNVDHIQKPKQLPTSESGGLAEKKQNIASLFAKGPPLFMFGQPPKMMDSDDLDDEKLGATDIEPQKVEVDESGLPCNTEEHVLQCVSRAKGPKRRPPRR